MDAIEVAHAYNRGTELRRNILKFVKDLHWAGVLQVELELEAIMRQANVRGQRGIGLVVRQIVRDVRKVSALRFQTIHQTQRVLDRRVRGMGMATQRIQKQDVKVLQLGERLFRHAAEVGEIGHRTEAIAFDGCIAVIYQQRSERRPKQPQWPIQGSYLNLREAAVFVVRLEDVAKDAAQHLRRRFAGEERDLAASRSTRKAERTDVVQPENVVGVAVRVKYRVNLPDALADRLLAEIRRSVDEHRVVAPLHHHRRARAAIVRVGRRAYAAVTADGRYSHRGAASQHGERGLHPALTSAPGPPCGERVIRLVTSRYAMRSSYRQFCSMFCSTGVRLPLVFSCRMASVSMVWRAPMRSTTGFSPGGAASPSCMSALMYIEATNFSNVISKSFALRACPCLRISRLIWSSMCRVDSLYASTEACCSAALGDSGSAASDGGAIACVDDCSGCFCAARSSLTRFWASRFSRSRSARRSSSSTTSWRNSPSVLKRRRSVTTKSGFLFSLSGIVSLFAIRCSSFRVMNRCGKAAPQPWRFAPRFALPCLELRSRGVHSRAPTYAHHRERELAPRWSSRRHSCR